MLRPLLSKQVEESQRIAKETRERERQREQDVLNERAKVDAAFAQNTAKLRALRLAKEAAEREEAANGVVGKARKGKKTAVQAGWAASGSTAAMPARRARQQ